MAYAGSAADRWPDLEESMTPRVLRIQRMHRRTDQARDEYLRRALGRHIEIIHAPEPVWKWNAERVIRTLKAFPHCSWIDALWPRYLLELVLPTLDQKGVTVLEPRLGTLLADPSLIDRPVALFGYKMIFLDEQGTITSMELLQ